MPTKKQETASPPAPIDESQMGIQEYLDHIKTKYEKSIADQAQETAKEIHDKIGQSPEQQWLPFAPMPTDMCRVSPFFPLNRNQLKEKEFVSNYVITKSAWGEILYSGYKLSVYDEDALLAVLGILDTKNKKEEIDRGRSSYFYEGPLRPVIKLMLQKSNPSKVDYTRFLASLDALQQGQIKLVAHGETHSVGGIVSYYHWKPKDGYIKLVISPYFYEIYSRGTVTLLDLLNRNKLSGPIAKSLFRFINSHREKKWSGHFLTLAATLNLNTENPDYKIRQQIKTAITQLKNKKLLQAKSGFTSKDMVYLLGKPDRSLLPK